jgi:hypothetical protein
MGIFKKKLLVTLILQTWGFNEEESINNIRIICNTRGCYPLKTAKPWRYLIGVYKDMYSP